MSLGDYGWDEVIEEDIKKLETKPKRKAATPKAKTRADEITTHLYEIAKSRGMNLRGMYPSTLKRIRELVEATKDPDQVELIALIAMDRDSGDFVAWQSLAWNAYEFFRDQLDVPPGAWKYALALEQMDEGPLRDSVDYWVQLWYDARDVDDRTSIQRARKALDKLLELD